MFRSNAAALSQAGNVTVRLTERLICACRIEGIYMSTSTARSLDSVFTSARGVGEGITSPSSSRP